MKKYEIMVIPGDGIGPEITEATLNILQTTDFNFNFETFLAGDIALEKNGNPLPEDTLTAAKNSEIILKGPIGETAKFVVLPLRQELDLYVNLRSAKNLSGIESRLRPGEEVDLLIVRENTEGLYSRVGIIKNNFAFNVKFTTSEATERIMKLGCELAMHRRKKITIVHKANVLETDILFRDTCLKVGKTYPEIDLEQMYVDNCSYQLIRDPSQFDVLVMGNLYGDILSDEASWVQGGLGLSPGANLGENKGMFEPVHGAAFDIQGKNLANPTAMIFSTIMMLEWIGKRYSDNDALQIADKIENAVKQTFLNDFKTQDLGGSLTTSKFTKRIIENLKIMN